MAAEAPQIDNKPSAVLSEEQSTPADPSGSSRAGHHNRMRTNTAEIDSTINHPGSVKINVQGAFIVDQKSVSPDRGDSHGGSHDTRDIRLPNHTAVVSHIAVDVRYIMELFFAIQATDARTRSGDPLPNWYISRANRIPESLADGLIS
jgi:type II pantothenate kinase